MPTLLHFFQNPSSRPGGTEKMMERINEVAKSLGFACDEVHEELFPLKNASRKFTMLDTPGNIVQMSWYARRQIQQADIVISHGVYGPMWGGRRRIHVLHSTHAGTAVAMKPHIPRLDFWVARHLWGGFFEKRNVRRSTCVAVSKFAAAEALQFYGVLPQVIPNSISPTFRPAEPSLVARIRRQLGVEETQKILLVVGRRERIKGWRVCEALLDELPAGVVLVSIGQGEAVSHPRLVTLGPTTPDQLQAYYSAADWTLSPSLYEGFGLTLLEAWACGCPVIATPTGLARDLYGQDPSFDRCVAERTDDKDSLLKIIHQAVGRQDWRQAQVTWSRSLLKTRYSFSAFATDWEALLTGSDKGASVV